MRIKMFNFIVLSAVAMLCVGLFFWGNDGMADTTVANSTTNSMENNVQDNSAETATGAASSGGQSMGYIDNK